MRKLSTISDLVNLANKRNSFGSFHSDDVSALIRNKKLFHELPAVYSKIEQATLSPFQSDFTLCSPSAKSLFNIDSNYTFLNHGAFGLSLNRLLESSNILK